MLCQLDEHPIWRESVLVRNEAVHIEIHGIGRQIDYLSLRKSITFCLDFTFLSEFLEMPDNYQRSVRIKLFAKQIGKTL